MPAKLGEHLKTTSNNKTDTATTGSTESIIGWVVHEHPDETSEGFGSHARGVLFPLIHIAIVNGLEPVFSTQNAFGNNTARDYSGLNVTSFLDLCHKLPEDETNYEALTINTWTDGKIGSACGDGKVLAELLKDHLHQLRQQQDENQDPSERRLRPFVIRLVGALRYMDPTKEVYDFLQARSLRWQPKGKTLGARSLRVAAHVRVPEDFCPQSWKDDNHISKLFPTLEKLKQFLFDGSSSCGNKNEQPSCELSVYTEERFSLEDERLLKEHYPTVALYRGNCETLTNDVKGLSTADILIPSSSHLSAFAGYLTHGLIVLSDASRWEYFRSHKQLGCQILDIHNISIDLCTDSPFNRIVATRSTKDNKKGDGHSDTTQSIHRGNTQPFWNCSRSTPA